MKSLAQSCIILGLIGLYSGSSEAGFEFKFVMTAPGIDVSGTLDAISNGDGSYTAKGGTGLISGLGLTPSEQGRMTLVVNPNGTAHSNFPGSLLDYDDQLFPNRSQPLDFYGCLFTLANGTLVNIYGLTPTTCVFAEAIGLTTTVEVKVSFVLTAVPEPSSLALLAVAGVPGLGCWWLRRPREARD